MEAPITEAYTVILTPKTIDGLDIRTFGTSHGQGRVMWPPTTDRWIAVTEQMMYRWLRYAPFRMELARREDMWFVDGAAVYYALLGTYETGIAESITPYLDEAYRQYNSTRLTQYTGGVVPATLYAKSTPGMRALRMQWGLMLAHFIDESIVQATDDAADLRHVLRRGFQQRKNVDLAKITKESTGLDIGHLHSTVIEPSDPPQVGTPMWYRETHPPGTRPRELPRTRGSSTAQDTLTLILTGRTQSFLEACGCNRAGFPTLSEEFPEIDLLVTTGHDYPSVHILLGWADFEFNGSDVRFSRSDPRSVCERMASASTWR